MNDLDQAKLLLQVAARDLRALEGMQDETVFADEIFGFHVQQAIEKCLKAWIAALDEVYPYTHDLGVLLSFLEQQQCDVTAFWKLLKYNTFAVQLRYQFLLNPVQVENFSFEYRQDLT